MDTTHTSIRGTFQTDNRSKPPRSALAAQQYPCGPQIFNDGTQQGHEGVPMVKSVQYGVSDLCGANC
jgi:hypothetical protein